MAQAQETVIIEINVQESISQLAVLNQELQELTKMRKDLAEASKKGDMEATKNLEALNSVIRQTKEEYRAQQRVVDGYVKSKRLEADTTNFANNSINANRALLKQLTAQYNDLKNPSKQATDTIRTLTDTLKQQESAVGNNSRNVGNYRESIVAAAKDINLFGVNIGTVTDVAKGFNDNLKGFGLGANSLKVLFAQAALGIGAVVVALVAVGTYLSKFEEGSELAERAVSGFGGAVDFTASKLGNLGKSIVDAFGDATQRSVAQNIEALGETIQGGLDAQRAGVSQIITGIGNALRGSFKEAGENIADGTLKALTFGVVSKDSLGDFVDGAKAAAIQAAEFTRQLQNLEDTERELAVIISGNQVQIDKLLASSRNRSKTEEERLAILKQASTLERENLSLELKGAEERLSIVRAQTDIKRQQGIVTEKVTADELVAIKRVDDLNRASLALQEKIASREAQIADALQKRREAEIAALDKLADARRKAEIEFTKATGANVDAQLAYLTDAGQKRIAIFELDFEDRRELLRNSGVSELAITKLYEQEKTKILQDEANKQYAIIQKAQAQDLAAINLLRQNAAQQLELQKLTNQTQEQIDQEFADSSYQTFAEYYAAKKKLYQDDATAQKANADAAKNVAVGLSNFLLQGLDVVRGFIEQSTQESLDSLQLMLDNGTITQEQFDKRSKDLKRQAFEETKALNIVTAVIQTAQAVLNAYNSGLQAGGPAGPAVGAVFAAIAGALGAAQISAIASQQAPKFALGGEASAITVGGNSHSEGGTLYRGSDGNSFEAERGEGIFVMKRDAYQNLHRLSAWNENFGGNSWFGKSVNYAADGGAITDGGYAARDLSGNVDASIILENAIKRGFMLAPSPVVSVVEIERVQGKRNQSIDVSELG